MLVIGFVMAVGSEFMPTSVHNDGDYSSLSGYHAPSDIVNIGLLQNQIMVFHAGLGLFIAGMIGMCIAELRDSMIRAGTAKSEVLTNPDTVH